MCYSDESTLINNVSFQNIGKLNVMCPISAFINAIGVHLIGLYTSALSISLYQTVEDSNSRFKFQ